MSERHPRELEPLTESINAFIESERENLDRQRNTLADLAHSLKTPLAVLRARLDDRRPEEELREEVDDAAAAHERHGVATSSRAPHVRRPPAVRRADRRSSRTPSRSCAAWRRSTPRKGVLCEFDIDPMARIPRRTRRPAGTARQPAGERVQVGALARAADRAARRDRTQPPSRPVAGGRRRWPRHPAGEDRA